MGGELKSEKITGKKYDTAEILELWSVQPGTYEARFKGKNAGLKTPDEIDKELGLVSGTAKKVIINEWKDDKAFSVRMVRI